MASISFDENCSVALSNHAKRLSFACNELFDQQQFSDVTLAAEDYQFNAHRLVLAAFSPYFQEMLMKAPVNQHAIVFLKDVSKQMLHDLMKYIYCGEVNINREHLDEFFDTAKALKVHGLIDDPNLQLIYGKPTNSSVPATKMAPKPAIRKFQYHSSNASVRPQSDYLTNLNPTTFPIYPAPRFYEQRRDTIDEYDVPETQADTHVSDEFFADNQFDDVQNDSTFESEKWSPVDDGQRKNIKRTCVDTSAQKRKKVKKNAGLSEYNIVADVRMMPNGRKSLFHDDCKFYAQQLGKETTRWLCTKHATKKCKAIMNTMEIDGKTMMKVVRAEHTHSAME